MVRRTSTKRSGIATGTGGRYYDRASHFETTLRDKYPNLRVHALGSSVAEQLRQKFRQKVPYSRQLPNSRKPDLEDENWVSYAELFARFEGRHPRTGKRCTVAVKGGFVRDLVEGKPLDDINDVDITYDRPWQTMKYKGMIAPPPPLMHGPMKKHTDGFHYVKVGNHDQKPVPMKNGKLPVIHEAVDCLCKPWTGEMNLLDAPVNSLLLNVGDGGRELDRLYDLTGHGYAHAKQRVWDWPHASMATDAHWLGDKRMWRMLKFAMRGYSVPIPVRRAVYTYWMDHYADADFPAINWRSPWASHLDRVPLRQLPTRCRHVLKRVADDFAAIGFGPNDAVRFVRMIVDKGMLTVPSQFATLSESVAKFKLPQVPGPIPPAIAATLEPVVNPDVQRLYTRLSECAAARHATVHTVFAYVQRMVDVCLMTVYPVLSTQSHIRTQWLAKQYPLVDYPPPPRMTPSTPSDSLQYVYPLHTDTASSIQAQWTAHPVVAPQTLADVVRVLIATPKVRTVHVVGACVRALWTKHTWEGTPALVVGGDVDAVRKALGVKAVTNETNETNETTVPVSTFVVGDVRVSVAELQEPGVNVDTMNVEDPTNVLDAWVGD